MSKYTLIKDDLGYMRCSPLPSQEELDKLYRDEFYTTAKPRYIERMEDDRKWWDEIYNDRLDILLEAMDVDEYNDRLLDVGSGGGFFVNAAMGRAWRAVGYEPNEVAREYSKKNQKGLFMSFMPTSDFEAIHISEVLEHLRNPLQMLQDCADRLLPGGAICVVVPNEKFDSTGNLVYPHVFQPMQHLNYFTFDTIEDLMRKAGFEIYERSATYPMETFLQIGLDYTKSEAIGRLCHHQRMSFDLSMTSQQRRKLYKELAAEGLGRECCIYGKKVS